MSPLELQTLAQEEKYARDKAEKLRQWSEHPWAWFTGTDLDGRQLIWTKDERDDQAPVKPFPSEKEYLQWFVNDIHENKYILVEKSRQMYISYTVCLYSDWHSAFRMHRQWVVSKIKEEAAAKLINDKIRSTYSRLPEWVQRARPIKPRPKTVIEYASSFSSIMAVAQNFASGDSRGITASGVIIDEGAFQDFFPEIMTAVLMMCEKVIAVSTANIGTKAARIYKLYLDEGKEVGREQHKAY